MARKAKGFGELLKQQQIKTGQQALNKLEQSFRQGPLGKTVAGIVKSPKGEIKMSEVLEEFVRPYLGELKTHRRREMFVEIAIIAWNVAVLPEAARQSTLDEFLPAALKGKDLSTQQEMKQLIDELILRKQEFFADNRRLIVDYELLGTDDEFQIAVASTVLPSLQAP